jgi:hypothetical protein
LGETLLYDVNYNVVYRFQFWSPSTGSIPTGEINSGEECGGPLELVYNFPCPAPTPVPPPPELPETGYAPPVSPVGLQAIVASLLAVIGAGAFILRKQ